MSPCGCLLPDLQHAIPSQGNRCLNDAASPAALLGCGSSSHHVCLPGLLCMPLHVGIICAFPAKRGMSKGSQKKKLMTCWCQDAGGVGRVGRAPPSLLSVQIDVAVPMSAREGG